MTQLRQLHPDEDFSHEVGHGLTRDNWMQDGVLGAPEPESPSMFVSGSVTPRNESQAMATTGDILRPSPNHVFNPASSGECSSDYENIIPSDGELDRTVKLEDLTDDMKALDVANFLGKSSGTRLILTAFGLRNEFKSQDEPDVDLAHTWRPTVWQKPSVRAFQHPNSLSRFAN